MKKIVLPLILCLLTAICAQAQDTITKTDGSEIKAKVLAVNPDNLKYKLWENPDGPTYTILKSEVLLVKYENGYNEVFLPAKSETSASSSSTEKDDYPLALNATNPETVVEGMKYKQLAKIYDYKSYIPRNDDRYSVAWGGWASFFLPGLGQMICGEPSRGVGFLTSSILFEASTIVSTCMLIKEIQNGGEITPWAIFTGFMYGACLWTDISAIVDGVRVAKVKNMYMQDLRTLKEYPELNVALRPYFSVTRSGIGSGLDTPVAGVSLCLNF